MYINVPSVLTIFTTLTVLTSAIFRAYIVGTLLNYTLVRAGIGAYNDVTTSIRTGTFDEYKLITCALAVIAVSILTSQLTYWILFGEVDDIWRLYYHGRYLVIEHLPTVIADLTHAHHPGLMDGE